MVSKRKSTNKNEAISSKKKVKTDEKVESNENQFPQPKKRIIKTKIGKEKNKKSLAKGSDGETTDVKNEIPISEEFDITELAEKTDINLSNPDLPAWPVEHVSELLRRIEFVLPQRDTLTYKTRIEKINWNDIGFANHTGAECRLMWDGIQKRIRRFRILKELIEDAKAWISTPWTNFYRGPKTNRHPDLPRRPLSIYMNFYLKKKDKILQKNPGLDMTELSKHISEKYKKLSAKSRLKYEEMAAVQRTEYDVKMKEFTRLHPDLVCKTTKIERIVASPAHDSAPRRPLTPFKLFCEDKRKRIKNEEDFDKALFIRKCKEQWRTMRDKKKVFWINWSLDKEEKYQEEIKKYVTENPDYIPTAYTRKSVVTKEERCIKERMAGKPEKPPNSAYSLFSRLMLVSEDVKRISPKERMLLIAQQWKTCTDVEKKEYSDRVKHMLEQYKLQYAEYLELLGDEERQMEVLNNQPKRKPRPTKPETNATKGESVNKKSKKINKTTILKENTHKKQKKDNLYQGEPEPPPATPYLLFQRSYPDKKGAQDVWEKMTEDERSFHRQFLYDLKRIYIEIYENFLKGLTLEELKEYSEWKKNAKLANHDSDVISDEDSGSDAECSANPNSDKESKGIK